MTPRKRGDLGTKGLNFGKREVVSSLRHTLVSQRQQFVCQKNERAALSAFAAFCHAWTTGHQAVAAPIVGKNSRSNAHFGVLLCGAEYQRKNAPESPPLRGVAFPRANERRFMVKHWCCAQWIARVADFLCIQPRESAANQRFIG
ncbi:hypothetical protein IVB22_20970 [Bradyrhizobium sp. 190]|uniref:hypothetical protein n=1 Tax=Bradyrhizobium sp. 190 TaxID=2782658 RepID=UPI001FFADD5B|nr:hypothetical protein [Bradyrhizobium sp. 190]MCK1514996.1 hypothetical protein [Bradyrhizobium sp. 190]